jgi:hypothetical protein
MKKIALAHFFLILALTYVPAFSQNDDEVVALGLPGDNLNLYAVLDIFQKSPTLEAFEKSINDKETNINNLDLNNDRAIDYINVVSYKEDDNYSIVLRVAINEKENQDIAVIEVIKTSNGKVVIQIIGDDELYGQNYIIEPNAENPISGTPNPGYSNTQVYYANDWPIINVMFSPGFVLYRSPWYWNYYPSYWRPWVPIFYDNYWNFHRHYYNNLFFKRHSYLRYPVHYHRYTFNRNQSNIVFRNKREGIYNSTYNARTYKKPDGPLTRERDANPRTKGTLPTTQQPRSRGTIPSTQQPRSRGNTPTTQQPRSRDTKPTTQQPRSRGTTPSTQQPRSRGTTPINPKGGKPRSQQ